MRYQKVSRFISVLIRSDLQDPFQKKFLQVKLSLPKTSSNVASSCQQTGELAIQRARSLRSGPACGLLELALYELAACELASSQLASSLATLPARGLLELATYEL
ncbi:UNVERIFIED_CONTAM: hypothetical protein Sradi_7096000, partial [Sesamum radiatum]